MNNMTKQILAQVINPTVIIAEKKLTDGSKVFDVQFGSVRFHCTSLEAALEVESQLDGLMNNLKLVTDVTIERR